MTAPAGVCRVSELADALLLNRCYGWYHHPGDLAAAERGLKAELTAWAGQGKPIIVAEYGADSVPGLHSLAPMPWTEEYQAACLDMHHRVVDRIDAVIGEHVWTFADFATGPGSSGSTATRRACSPGERRPKAAAHLLRRRWAGQG